MYFLLLELYEYSYVHMYILVIWYDVTLVRFLCWFNAGHIVFCSAKCTWLAAVLRCKFGLIPGKKHAVSTLYGSSEFHIGF